MRDLIILNSKEKKKILKKIEEQWKPDLSVLKEFVFLRTTKGKIFIANKEVAELELQINMRNYSIGNYLGSDEEEHGFRLTIEGSQILGPTTKQNILELNQEQKMLWMSGKDLEYESDCKGYCIIKSENDYMGTGKCSRGLLLNFVPKTRRLNLRE